MPRTIAPRLAPLAESIAWPKTKGAAPRTCVLHLRLPRHVLPVGHARADRRISMCDATERMRLRNSSWKPFITEITTINAATPSAIPAIDTAAMNDTKPLRLEPRRARK